MTNCKKHLSYIDLPKGEMDDIALPFLLKVKSYIAKPPSFGYYIKKLLQSFTLITLIFRCIDGVTDFTLTGTYFTNWEKVINDSFTQAIAKQNKTMNELCMEEFRLKVVCIIPNLRYWWIPGMLSALVLFITWLVEAVSIIVGVKGNKPHFIHFCEVFSRSCCKNHMPCLVYASGFILPFTQQVSSLIYEHWLKSFATYWKEKSQYLTNSELKKDPNCKCAKKCKRNEACLYCSSSVDTMENLDQLNMYADKISGHSKTVTASTENLLMPMIQLAFLFPFILSWFCRETRESKQIEKETPLGWLVYLEENWTTLLITTSTISSISSLAGSQTSIYFSSPEKRNQKTLTTRVFIFTITILQVIPKVLAFQMFAFGVVGLNMPELLFIVLFFLPILSSIWKITIIWLFSACRLRWKEVWQLSGIWTFIFTKLKYHSNEACCATTRNGRYHILFDSISLLENGLLSFFGGQNIAQNEEDFNKKLFLATVVGIHLFGLLLKCCYYRYQHPWMSLSMVYKDFGKVLQAIIVLLGLFIIVALPLSVEIFSLSSTYASVMYTLFGFVVIMVSTISMPSV